MLQVQCFAKCPFTSQFDRLSDQLRQSLDRLSDYFAKHCAGDYWPGEAEVLLNTITEENRVAGKRGGAAAGAPEPSAFRVYGSGPLPVGFVAPGDGQAAAPASCGVGLCAAP